MKAAFETFVRDLSHLREGQQTILVLRDLAPGRRKYFAQNVLATVSTDPGAATEWQPLRVRSTVGSVFPGQWYVKIIRVLPSRIPGTPYTNAYEAMHRAWAHLLCDRS